MRLKDLELEEDLFQEDEALVLLYQESLAKELLKKIGFRVFVEKYFDLKKGHADFSEFTKGSARIRRVASTALFRNKLHLISLKLIADSQTLPRSLAETAKAILNLETL